MSSTFTSGDIAVLQLAGPSNNTTGTIVELAPTGAAQTPALTVPLSATGPSAMRFSDSGTSSFLSDTNDGTLLVLSGYNTADATDSNLATSPAPLNVRAAATLDNNANLTIQATYSGTSANQTRSATSLDDSNYYFTDKGGLYTNGSTASSFTTTTNILNTRAFGGVVYVSSTAGSASNSIAAVSTLASPTATALTALPGLPTGASADTKIQDFYLVQSGQNGATYDLLYTLDQGSPTSSTAQINKYSLNTVTNTWQAQGTYALRNAGGTAISATSMIAQSNGAGGFSLYVVTTAQAAGNSVVQYTDTSAYNATISVNGASSVTLYTANPTTATLKGIAFAPAVSVAPTVTSPTKSGIGINGATLGGTVTDTGGQPVTSYGVVYALTSTNSNPTIGGLGVTQVPAGGAPISSPFSVSVSGLQGTSGYSYAAYATNSVGTAYSSVDTFSTLSANAPTVDQPTDTAITTSSATLGGTVESNGGATITKTGVVYALTSSNSNPRIGGAGVTEIDTATPSNGAFTVSAAGLSSGAGYSFEAFAVNSSGTTYTPATTFNTLAAPALKSPTFAAVTSTSAALGANVTSNGGSTLTKTGVVYALTSANANPQIGGAGVTEVDTASASTGVFSVAATGLSGSSAYTFEAFATNGVGTTYTPATSFTTAAPGIIAAWTFPATAAAPDNSPAPTYGTGTATTLGMTNTYNGGNTASDDVLVTAGTADPNFSENTWRIRGTAHNGWATAAAGAPEFSQGLQLDTSTVGYSNIVFSFDWYSTTQGIRDLQVQYNTGSGWANYQGPSPTGTFVATANDYFNSALSPVNPTIHIDLSGVAAANNNPDLGIRLVSAFDSTGNVGNEYASAQLDPTSGHTVVYNNSSGNWRFGNLTFAAGTTTSTAIAASPNGSQNHGENVTFTATVTPSQGSQFPSGTVAFFDGATQIGAAQPVSQVGTSNVGTASLTLNTLSAGVHGDITAQYTPAPGDGLIASGSSMNLTLGDPTDNPISYIINAPQATGVDVSPVAGQSFTGVVATFSDGANTDPTGFTATIDWGDGHTSSGVIAFSSDIKETNILGAVVDVKLYTVTGTNTYAATGTYPLSVSITDPGNNTTTVNPNARVAGAPLVVTGVASIDAAYQTAFSNQTVATFTDPGLVANLAALGIADPTTQFTASINWGDGSSLDAGTISYDPGSQRFSVAGSHTYSQTGNYSVSVAVTPLTVSVERTDSSDPNKLNEVGDENGNGLTDAASADFIDQFAIGATNQAGSLYTFSLPTVSTTSGNEALTNSSYSRSEGELTLSSNGQYLVTGGYNLTVNLWGPQSTFSPASVINRVIATVDGQGDINTTTALSDAYSGDNFRGVVSTDGTQFWTAGHATANDGLVHFAQLGATTSTLLTGPNDPSNINTVEIFNGQLYEGVRSVAADAPAGIYQIGTGLPTTAGQPQSLFISVPQSNPLDVTDSDKPTSPVGFFMADLNDGNPTVNGVNVAYVADAEMGIARYDFTNSGWQFSYYINSTGSFLNSAFTVDSAGNVTAASSFNPSNPGASGDPSKAGGVRELTGRIVNGQVQLFAVTGFGTGSEPNPGGSVIEVTDTGANAGFTTLATNTGASAFTGVAFTPTQTVTSPAQVSKANQAITFTAPTSPIVFAPSETVTLNATGGASGNPVAFSIDPASTGAGSISGNVLTVTGAGNIVLDANQAGNGNYNAAPQVQQTLVVSKDATTTKLVSSTGGVSNQGQNVTFTATLTANPPGGGTPDGNVQFLINNTVVNTVALSGGQASFTTTSLALGSDSITARYLGSGNYLSSSSSITQNVNLAVGILLLDKTGSGALTDSGSGRVSVSNGSIVDDSTSSSAISVSGGASVSATQVNDSGGASLSGSGKLIGPLKTGQPPAADPLSALPAPDPTTMIVQSSSTLNIGGNTTITLKPGVYVGGISIGGSAKVTLTPGVYYLKGGGFTVGGAAKVTDLGQGVLLYNAAVKSTDSINVGGSGSVTLSPLVSGPYQGIVIFQARTATAALSFSGAAAVNLAGSVYAASAAFDLSGSASVTINKSAVDTIGSTLIVDDLNDSGAGDLTINL